MSEQEPPQDPLEDIELHGRSVRQWMTYLEREGDLRVPASRYGRTTSDCSPWAVACEFIYCEANGESEYPNEAVEYYMGLVVNDDASVLELVLDYWHDVPDALKEHLDYYDGDCNLFQQAALRGLCRRYNVAFVAEHYRPQFDLPDDWVAGFIGGWAIQKEHPTLYVGCSPEGEIHS